MRLGIALAHRGWLVRISIALAAIVFLGGIAMAIKLAHDGDGDALADLSALVSGALAWGVGVLVAFAAASEVLREDAKTGVRLLARARGATTWTYLGARIIGLAIVLAIVVGGGTLLVGIPSLFLSAELGLTGRTLQTLCASLVFSLAFSMTLAPLAVGALGARSRAGGYAVLLMLLVVPELLAPEIGGVLSRDWVDVASIPAALSALRTALLPTAVDPARFFRAACVVAIVIAMCTALARRELVRVTAEETR